MKEPFLFRRKRPNQAKKLKLVCSFNGTFQARPPSGKLRYTDGETRIVSVDRNIGFSSLKSRVSELISHCPVNNGVKSFSLKYQLPLVDDDAPPVLITSDDDVRCMIEEYEKLESLGKPTRLRIFSCKDNGYVCGQRAVNGFSVNCVEAENLNDGSGVSCKNSNGFVRDTLNGDGFECRISTTRLLGGEFGCDKVKKLAMGVNGVRSGDDSLRKMVLKQQLLAKQSAKIWSFRGSSGLDGEQTEMEFTSENKKRDQPLVGLTSESEGPASHDTTGLEFGGNPYRAIVLDDEFSNNQIQRSDNFGINPPKVSHSHTMNPRDGNPLVETNSCGQCLKNSSGMISLTSTGPTGSSWFAAVEQFQKLPYDTNMDFVAASSSVQTRQLSNLDSENITPCDLVKTRFAPLSCSNQLARGVYSTKSSFGGLHTGSYHNYGCTAADMRNQKASPYHIRSYMNSLTELGNHLNLSLEGRPWVRKFHPSLRSSSNISKQRQTMRLYYPSLWKPWPSYNGHTLEGIQRMMDSDLNNQTSLLDQPYGCKENFSDNGGHGVSQPQKQYPMQSHSAYSPFMASQIFLPINVTKNSRSMNTWEDLLIVATNVKHGVLCQALCNNLREKESESMEPMESINNSLSPNNLGFRNGTEMGYNSKLAGIESSVKSLVHQNNAHAVLGQLISSVDLSLCNPSLSSSKEVEALDDSSLTSSDVAESLLKPQSKAPDLMDGEQISSGLQIEMSNAVDSNSSSQKVAKLERVDQQKEVMQQDHTSSLSLERNADIQKSHNCSMPKGGSPSDLVVFYADSARRELQNIKNSDLEYIKELGSGTYGTVFYGKWKGCDVAIKKLKPCCFTEGAPEHDRLVADFWKEAYILGQLHHPHIVALYGVVTDGPVTNFATVTEYMVNGSLKQVLRRKDRTIDRRKRLIIAMDAAFGVEYLHEKKIVHFDLKSHNLLVNMRDPWRPLCKVGDLGLSKIKQRTLVSGGVRGTLPWMAPELLNSKENMVTEKVDVYSFGIVMWELLTGDEPYGKMRTEEIIAGIIKGNLRPEIPNWCDPAWRSLMERCWSSDPDSRPAFSEIAKELRTMSAAMNIK